MGCVNVFLPAIYTWTGFWIKALVFNSQAEGQNFLRQTILYDYNNKSNKRQVKETVPTWSQNWLPPCNRKRCWCWERLKAGEGDDQGWDSWMASPTQWTWVWASSGSCWRTGRPGMLQGLGSQRVRHDWVTELQQIHNADTQCTEGQRETKEQERNFYVSSFLAIKYEFYFTGWICFQAHPGCCGTRFLAVVGLRCPFPVGSLTLLPEPAHFPFQDFLMVPCVLWVFPSITSFYLQPEKVICSRDRWGVFVSYGCHDNKLPETVTYEHWHLFSYCSGDQMSDKDLSSWAKIKMLSGLISSGGCEGRESISLPLPPSRGFLHSLACGPFFHLKIHHFSLCFSPGTPAPPILTSPSFKDHCDDRGSTRIIREPHLKVLTCWLLPLRPQVWGLGRSECEYIWGSFFSFPGRFPHNSVKNPPAMQETLVRFLGQEDPLEKG